MISRLLRRLFASRNDFWAALLGALLGTLTAAIAYFVLLESRGISDALFLRELVPRPLERKLIDVVLICKTTLLGSVPALAFALLEGRRRRAWAAGVYLASLWLCFFFLIVDLRVYLLHGRHLLEILAYAALPEGRQAGGSVALWLFRFAVWALQALVLAACGLGTAWLGSFCGTAIRSRPLRILLALPLALGLFGSAPVAAGPGAGWRTAGLQARLLGVLPLSLGAERMLQGNALTDLTQPQLDRGLNTIYQQKFSYVFRKRERQAHESARLKATPSVFLILVESLRADAFSAELMPELYAWAQQGLRRSYHLAGTNFSESGAFTILYGLNPLVYHAVLDSAVPPPLCEGLRAQSYHCAYYTGHPTIWWRREEFLGPSSFDIHQRVQQGPWSEWDERSLAAFAALPKSSPERAYLDITFLMSTHYEYRYPPEFERFVPATEPKVSWDGTQAGSDFTALRNRYKNSVGFVDHLIGQALRSIDTTRNYVIVTGDHAEAIGENGKVGHGYDFSDTLLHVPFVLRGPGIAAEELGGISLHRDIWPTVLSLVTGMPPGEGDLRQISQRKGGLWAHCGFDQQEADALLVHDDLRVRMTLGLRTPEVVVQGFEDAQGRPLRSPSLSDQQTAALIEAFGSYLDDAAKPVLLAQ